MASTGRPDTTETKPTPWTGSLTQLAADAKDTLGRLFFGSGDRPLSSRALSRADAGDRKRNTQAGSPSLSLSIASVSGDRILSSAIAPAVTKKVDPDACSLEALLAAYLNADLPQVISILKHHKFEVHPPTHAMQGMDSWLKVMKTASAHESLWNLLLLVHLQEMTKAERPLLGEAKELNEITTAYQSILIANKKNQMAIEDNLSRIEQIVCRLRRGRDIDFIFAEEEIKKMEKDSLEKQEVKTTLCKGTVSGNVKFMLDEKSQDARQLKLQNILSLIEAQPETLVALPKNYFSHNFQKIVNDEAIEKLQDACVWVLKWSHGVNAKSLLELIHGNRMKKYLEQNLKNASIFYNPDIILSTQQNFTLLGEMATRSYDHDKLYLYLETLSAEDRDDLILQTIQPHMSWARSWCHLSMADGVWQRTDLTMKLASFLSQTDIFLMYAFSSIYGSYTSGLEGNPANVMVKLMINADVNLHSRVSAEAIPFACRAFAEEKLAERNNAVCTLVDKELDSLLTRDTRGIVKGYVRHITYFQVERENKLKDKEPGWPLVATQKI